MTETITKKIGETEIIFYPNSHQYKIGKEKITSVSAITGVVDKPALRWWASGCACDEILAEYEKGNINPAVIQNAKSAFTRVSKKATDIGEIVHNFCENFALHKLGKGEKTELPEDEKALSGCLAFLRWHDKNEVEFIEVERFVYSNKHNYCGKFDLLAKVNGKLCLIDYKTSKDFYPLEMGAQVMGYKIAIEEEGVIVEDRIILRFDKETGNFETHKLTEDKLDKSVFLSCLEIKKAQLFFNQIKK